MDISTNYLSFDLPNPFIAGAGPLADTPAHAKEVEDAGAAAIVMHSLFEEQVNADDVKPVAEKASSTTAVGVLDQYLEQLRKIKEAVDIPVFASINGHTAGPWLDVGLAFEQAGADALELNIYYVATDPQESATTLEQRSVEMVRGITKAIKLPVAAKLSPFYTSLAQFAGSLEKAGAAGIVLFNRFFESDIDLGLLKAVSRREFSNSGELLLRLRWLSVLSASLDSATLAVSGGVHSGKDAIKAIICGASAVQMVSALLKNGPGHLSKLQDELTQWMQHNRYESLDQMRGNVNISRTRADYMRLLQTWAWLYGGRG